MLQLLQIQKPMLLLAIRRCFQIAILLMPSTMAIGLVIRDQETSLHKLDRSSNVSKKDLILSSIFHVVFRFEFQILMCSLNLLAMVGLL